MTALTFLVNIIYCPYLWKSTLLQLFNVFMLSKSIGILLKMDIHALLAS
jgi:hypothetical protein